MVNYWPAFYRFSGVAGRDISGNKDVASGANGRTEDVAMTNVNATYSTGMCERVEEMNPAEVE
jgi:hypothetical protein